MIFFVATVLFVAVVLFVAALSGRMLRRGVERGGCCGRVLSVAAFWAGAAHPRRQKHREMPPPGASAPAFAATVEPTFTQITFDLPPAHLQSDSSNERVLGMTCCVHRFLISGPNLGIDARFSRFTPSFVHRFLISGPNLGIDARFSRFTATRVHRFLILGGQFGNRCMDCPETASLLQRFLISGPDLRITASFSQETALRLQRFSISGGQFGNHRKFFPGNKPKAAVILDFRPKLANHCRVPPAASVAAANIRVQF